MNKATILLAAIGLVLVGVVVTRTPAQQVVGGGGCCLPNGNCFDTSEINCASIGGNYLGDAVNCLLCPSIPTVVGMSATAGATGAVPNVFRVWSDGQVDYISFNISTCTPDPLCIVIPGTCPTDIDRDGDTGINDFLDLLGGWGPCP